MCVRACEPQIKTLRGALPELWICAHFTSGSLIKVLKHGVIFPSFCWWASLAAHTQRSLSTRPSHGTLRSNVTSIGSPLQQPPSWHKGPLWSCPVSWSSQVRGKSQTGRQTWLPPSSIHWLQATSSRLPPPTGYWLSTATDAGLQTPAWSAGLQTASCGCTVSTGDPCWLQTTGTARPRIVCQSWLCLDHQVDIFIYIFAVGLLQALYILLCRILITSLWSWRKALKVLASVSVEAGSTRWTCLCCVLLRMVPPYVTGGWGWDAVDEMMKTMKLKCPFGDDWNYCQWLFQSDAQIE